MAESIRRYKQTEPGIVITGMGAVSPLGLSVDEMWQNVINGKTGMGIYNSDYSQITTKVAGQIHGFNPETLVRLLPRKEINQRLHSSALYSLSASFQALLEAGLIIDDPNIKNGRAWGINSEIVHPERVVNVIGTGSGGSISFADMRDRLRDGKTLEPSKTQQMLVERVTTPVSKAFGIKGPTFTIVGACATSNFSMTTAIERLRSGVADVALVGGAEGDIIPEAVASFESLHALDQNPDPETTPNPFDKERGGFTISHGAGVLIFEREKFARARGAHIYGRVVGYADTSDAFHDTDPSGEGAKRAMEQAWNMMNPKRRGRKVMISPHATATGIGDEVESKIIAEVAKELGMQVVGISGTKGETGHPMGAAGGIEAIICIKALDDQLLPPMRNLKNPMDNLQRFFLPRVATKAAFDLAISNSFGFGGLNSTLIFSRN